MTGPDTCAASCFSVRAIALATFSDVIRFTVATRAAVVSVICSVWSHGVPEKRSGGGGKKGDITVTFCGCHVWQRYYRKKVGFACEVV